MNSYDLVYFYQQKFAVCSLWFVSYFINFAFQVINAYLMLFYSLHFLHCVFRICWRFVLQRLARNLSPCPLATNWGCLAMCDYSVHVHNLYQHFHPRLLMTDHLDHLCNQMIVQLAYHEQDSLHKWKKKNQTNYVLRHSRFLNLSSNVSETLAHFPLSSVIQFRFYTSSNAHRLVFPINLKIAHFQLKKKTRYYSFDYFPNFNLKTEELFSLSAIQKVQ